MFFVLLCFTYSVETDLPSTGETGDSDSNESTCTAGHPGLISESERYSGEGNGNPLQYSCLENSMDRGAQQAIQSRGLKRVGHD